MGIVVVRSPKCLRGLLRRLFGLRRAFRLWDTICAGQADYVRKTTLPPSNPQA